MGEAWRLVRGPNLVIAAAGVVAGGWIAERRVATPNVLVLAALAAVGYAAAGYVLNDIWDVAADRVNRSPTERPLAAGRVARGAADLYVVAGALVGLAASMIVSGTAVLVGLASLAVMTGYSPVLKRRGAVGNLAVALVAGLPLMYGAIAVGPPGAGLVPWTLAAWLHLVREVVKDLADAPGDRALGRRTLPIAWGPRLASRLAAALAVGFVPVSLVLPLRAHYGLAYFVIAAVAQALVLVVAGRLVLGRMAANAVLLKGAMLVGLVALVAGRVA